MSRGYVNISELQTTRDSAQLTILQSDPKHMDIALGHGQDYYYIISLLLIII